LISINVIPSIELGVAGVLARVVSTTPGSPPLGHNAHGVGAPFQPIGPFVSGM
jgi:hypothetical protein